MLAEGVVADLTVSPPVRRPDKFSSLPELVSIRAPQIPARMGSFPPPMIKDPRQVSRSLISMLKVSKEISGLQ
jgi:hypothetical protein